MTLRGNNHPSRSLALTVTSTNCSTVRSEPYRTRMELIYDYLVEYNDVDGALPDLIGIESAISYGVAGSLNTCDSEGSPLFAVELASRHRVAKEGYCVPLDPANKCKVVQGVTAIRFDTKGLNDKPIDLLAYEAIESVLSESEFLKQFVANPHERVGFVQIRGKTVSQIAGRGNNATSASKVAIAAGTVSFLLAAIFLGGIFRKKRREKKARMRKQLEPGKGKRFLLGSAPRKYYELDEEQENACGFKVLDLGPGEPYYENPSTTWSISDITSESGSILSNLSRTTSKLERIEEVEEECPTDEEWDGTDTDDHINSIPAEYLYDMSSPRHHVGQFDAGIEDPADPEGCRYLDDSSRASSSSNDMDDEIEMIGLSGIDDYLLECSDDSDDEGGTLEEDLMGLSAMEKYLIPELDSLSNSSAEDEGEQEKQQEQSRAMVLHESAWEWDEISDASASQWMVELLKELRKSQRRKLLTYGTEEHGSTAT